MPAPIPLAQACPALFVPYDVAYLIDTNLILILKLNQFSKLIAGSLPIDRPNRPHADAC